MGSEMCIRDRRTPGAPLPTAAALSRAAANLDAGRTLFLANCAVCHGEDGKSGHGAAPSLASLKDLDAVLTTITNGRNTMPSFRSAFTAEQIRDVGAYVVQVLAASPRAN